MELRNIGLSQQVREQLHSIGRQKEASPLETLEMTLRQHFGLPVPEKWKIDLGPYEVSQIGRTKSYLFLRGIYHP